MSKDNPLNKDEINRQAIDPKRIEPELETDSFSPEEQRKIVEMVLADAAVGEQAMAEWVQKKKRDIQHLNSDKPSLIEGITKDPWMSDRNLGLAAGTHDIYQATLLATCWNPETIHFKPSEKNDVNNRDNAEKFMKWVASSCEANLDPEVDDFINNRTGVGFSLFKVYWEVTYQWVDKRIPKPSKDNKARIIGYDIKTEERRFERGRMVNIDHLDDILIPEYGKSIQELPFLIERLKNITHDQLAELARRKAIVNFKDGKFVGIQEGEVDTLKKEAERGLGTTSTVQQPISSEKKNVGVTIYEAYTTFTKDGKTEKYRFWVEPTTQCFLSGKPLRKLNRAGKVPYFGGPLRRRPGFIRGGSLIGLIAPVINALNNAFNQTSDFQYFENCPDGFYDKNILEGGFGTLSTRAPGLMQPIDGNPNEKIFVSKSQRSFAWSYQFFQFCIEMIERLTGAASYFLTSDSQNSTATRDNIVEEKGQVKFGLWVKRIQIDIAEALNMLFSMYQDWAEPEIGRRVIGEDGKEIIKNLSINSIRGNLDLYLTPDITSGSKAYESMVAQRTVQAAMNGCMWLDPRLNPRGNWIIWRDFFKSGGVQNPEQFMPPQPKEQMDYSQEALDHFNQLKQGDRPEPPSADNPQIVECLATFERLKDTRYQELDEEYRPNFDQYLLKAVVNYQKFTSMIAQQHMEMQIAAKAIQNVQKVQGMAPPQAPPAPTGGPNIIPVPQGGGGFGPTE